MTVTIKDALQARERVPCVGRDAALASQHALLTDDRPLVMALQGLGGVGKTCVTGRPSLEPTIACRPNATQIDCR